MTKPPVFQHTSLPGQGTSREPFAAGNSFAIRTFGCKINQYEAQALREAWLSAGLVEVPDPDAAEVVVINSCAVTEKAVADLRKAVRQVARTNPDAVIVITGCAATLAETGISDLPGVALVVPQPEKARLLPEPAAGLAPRTFAPFAVNGYDRARPVVKIQDGCDQFCTYCIVPLTRGRAVSREPEAVLAEAERLLDAGFRELIVSGVNLRAYGRDLAEEVNLWGLLRRLEARLAPRWAGRARLRLSSLDPSQLTPEALDTLGASRLVCPQLHLSLQSLSPGVLTRMNRAHYRPEAIAAFLAELARVWPVFGLGADLLTGFPGESEAEYAEGLAAVRALPLTYAHVFPYSPRPGTKAAALPDQVAPEARRQRAATLRRLAGQRKAAFLRRLAALPELVMAMECAAAGGVSQFYAACRLDSGAPALPARRLVRARPLGLSGDAVLVAPLEVLP